MKPILVARYSGYDRLAFRGRQLHLSESRLEAKRGGFKRNSKSVGDVMLKFRRSSHWQRTLLGSGKLNVEQDIHNAVRIDPDCRWNGGDGIVGHLLRFEPRLNWTVSTITYDTLIRAGVQAISAFVPDPQTPVSKTSHPPFAKGSRGI